MILLQSTLVSFAKRSASKQSTLTIPFYSSEKVSPGIIPKIYVSAILTLCLKSSFGAAARRYLSPIKPSAASVNRTSFST